MLKGGCPYVFHVYGILSSSRSISQNSQSTITSIIMAESAPSLRSHFLCAKSKEEELQHIESTSSAHRENLQSTIARYEECRDMIHQLAIFSRNETSEDIATSAIQ
jgi:TAP42-like family